VEDVDRKVEDEDYVTQIWRNEEKKKMEDLEVNIVLSLELQMTEKSLSNNCKSEALGYKILKF
jgi:hypothetical protein